VKAALASIIALRTVVNITQRGPGPFLVLIAASFGAQAESVSWLGASFSMAAFVAPFSGAIEHRLGRRRTVLMAMMLFVSSCLLVPVAPSLLAVAALFVLIGVAKSLFEPQTLAFVSENVSLAQRGAAIGLIELAWALSWIIGTPLLGYLIEFGQWWMLWVLMAGAASLCTVLVLRYAGLHDQPAAGPVESLSLRGFRAVLRSAAAQRVLLYGVLIALPVQVLGLVYGPHMQAQFSLSPVQLGIASTVIGIADLLAELAAVALIDRVGQRRALLVSCVGYALALISFALWATSFVGILIALFLIFFCFEFTLVTSLAVQSEFVPEERATMAGFVASVHGFGRIVGSLVAVPLFVAGGIALPTWIGVLIVLAAVVVGWRLAQNMPGS
jgi:predicted MFS family arabinose efflux permease